MLWQIICSSQVKYVGKTVSISEGKEDHLQHIITDDIDESEEDNKPAKEVGYDEPDSPDNCKAILQECGIIYNETGFCISIDLLELVSRLQINKRDYHKVKIKYD